MAQVQAPRDQLTQMITQLQAAPANDSLRVDVIKLALTLDPPPSLPEEAERRMARGTAAFKGAASPADYAVAAAEFEQATMAAPWYGDAYFNLGTAQDKADKYSDALRSLKLALLASPDDKALKTLLYEVEFRSEQHSPAAEAARKQNEFDQWLKKLDGRRYVTGMPPDLQMYDVRGRVLVAGWSGDPNYSGTAGYHEGKHVEIKGRETVVQDNERFPGHRVWVVSFTYIISEDGGKITVRTHYSDGDVLDTVYLWQR